MTTRAGGDLPAHTLLRPSFERRDDRGVFVEVLNGGHWECLIRGEMRTGAVMGNHYHKRTDVFFALARGAADVTWVDVEAEARDVLRMAAGDGVVLTRNTAHAIRFREDSAFVMLKSLRYDERDPDTFAYAVVEPE